MAKDTVDIIKGLVALMTPTVMVSGAVTNPDSTFTLSISNTHWLRIDKRIQIDSLEYRIVSFIINESITISGSILPVVSSFPMPAPHFEHGTVEPAAIEQGNEMDPTLRTPFIYLIEPIQETDITDEEMIWGRESSPRLYFMDESDTAYNPTKHKTNVIEPARQMVNLFFSKIKEEEDYLYKEVLQHKETAAADWGKFVLDKGYEGKFFNDTISGLQVDFDFTMSKTACSDVVQSVECKLKAIMVVEGETFENLDNGKAYARPCDAIGVSTYAWAGPSGFTSTDQNITGLSPGVYTVTITDSAGCSAIAIGTVTAGPVSECSISIDSFNVVAPTFFKGSDGTATGIVSGNIGSVLNFWEDGQTTATAAGLSAGNLPLSVLDGDLCNCIDKATAIIPEGHSWYLNFNGVDNHVEPVTPWTVNFGQGFIVVYDYITALNQSTKSIITSDTADSIQHRLSANQLRIFLGGGEVRKTVGLVAPNVFHRVIFYRRTTDDRLHIIHDGVDAGNELDASGFTFNYIAKHATAAFAGGIDNLLLLAGVDVTNIQLAKIVDGQDPMDVMGAADINYRMDHDGLTAIAEDSSGNNNDGILKNYINPPTPWTERV